MRCINTANKETMNQTKKEVLSEPSEIMLTLSGSNLVVPLGTLVVR